MQTFEQLDLQRLVFRGRFDDEVRLAQAVKRGRRVDVRENLVALLLRHLAARHHSIQAGPQTGHPARDDSLGDVVQQHIEPRLRGDLRDSAAHLSRPNDADRANVHISSPSSRTLSNFTRPMASPGRAWR